MKKVEKRIVNNWYKTIEDSEKFLDFADGLNINSFRLENGVRKVLFEDGVYTYSVDREMCETDGEKEKEIIDLLEECGVEFREVGRSFIETGACGTYYDWGCDND